MSSLKENIYFRSIFYFLDFAGILSIIYINLNSEYFRICLNKYDINNYIDLSYSWLFVIFVVFRYVYMYYTRDVVNTSIVAKTISFFVRFVLNICSAGISFLSFRISWLQTHYVDYIPLKFNFFIHRVWTIGDLREYLCDVLLQQSSIVSKFKDLQVDLPLPDNIIDNLLSKCTTISQVDITLNKFIEILESKRVDLGQNKFVDESHGETSSIIGNIQENMNVVHTYLYDNNVYWWLAGLTVAVVLTFVGYNYLNSSVIGLARESKETKDGLKSCVDTNKVQNEYIETLTGKSNANGQFISSLNEQQLKILDNQKVTSSTIDKLSGDLLSLGDDVESIDNGLKKLSIDVNNSRTNVTNLHNNVLTLDTNLSDVRQDVSKVCTDLNVVRQDVSDVCTGLNVARQDVSSLKTSLSGVRQDVSNVITNLSDVRQDVSSVNTSLNGVRQDVSNLYTDLKEVREDVLTVGTDLNGVRNDVLNLCNGSESIRKDVHSLSTDIANLRTGISKLSDDVNNSHINITNVRTDVNNLRQELGTNVNNLSANVSNLNDQFLSLNESVNTNNKNIRDNIERLSIGANDANERIHKLEQSNERIQKLEQSNNDSISLLSSHEQQFSIIGTVLKKYGEQLESTHDKLLKIQQSPLLNNSTLRSVIRQILEEALGAPFPSDSSGSSGSSDSGALSGGSRISRSIIQPKNPKFVTKDGITTFASPE